MKLSAQRLLEIFPGLATWLTFIIPVVLSFTAPLVITILILIYAIYWFINTLVMSLHLIEGYIHYRHAMKINWLKACQTDFSDSQWRHLYHLVIIATYKEDLPILRASFNAIVKSDYPLDKLIIVFAVEQRDQERGLANAHALEKEFGSRFHHFATFVHPDKIPGEVRGKGGNITYAAKTIKQTFVDPQKIPYEDIIVTTLDADHRVDPQYFACLTHNYLTTPDPIHKSFQPIPLFFNNIWQAAFPMRMIAMGSSFWQLIEATRPYRLRNFASHSQSFAGLVKTDFWSVSTIVEDGHQYWRSYFAFHGNYEVIPIFVPIYQDAILAGNFWVSAKEQYLQKRRWAWGASDIPYAVIHAVKDHQAPFVDKWMQVWRLIQGNYSWSTTSLVLAFFGWIPLIINPGFRTTVLAANFPLYYGRILTAAMIGMIITLIISTILLPPPPGSKRMSRLRIAFEWIITPFVLATANIIFSNLPAIDSQTRLMFGRYLGEFRVTIKKPVVPEIKDT